jgi:hypothetical protein
VRVTRDTNVCDEPVVPVTLLLFSRLITCVAAWGDVDRRQTAFLSISDLPDHDLNRPTRQSRSRGSTRGGVVPFGPCGSMIALAASAFWLGNQNSQQGYYYRESPSKSRYGSPMICVLVREGSCHVKNSPSEG